MADSTVSPCKGVAPAAVKEGEDPSADSSKHGSGVSLRETSASAIDTSADSSTASSVSTPAAGTAPAAAADSEPAAAASGSAPAAGGSAPAASATDSSDEADEKPGSLIQSLLAYVESKLPGTHTDTDEQQCVLNSLDQAGVVDYIKSGRCKNVITLAGAGISTSAGIPDFRSPDSGLYNNLEAYDLPQPEAVFELSYFRRNPQPFFKLAKELYPGEFRPTPCHYFVRLLETKGLLRRHYTQNIDTLEHVAGISADKVVEAHGTFRTAHCLDCRKPYTQSWVKMEVFADRVPTCLDCNGVVKPDIVFFGESLPTRFFESVSSDFSRCDMLLIMGTSLTVQPFAGLIEYVGPECPRVLINRETVGETDSFMEKLNRLMNRMSGLRLSRSDNYRDVALLGDCDDTCINLAKLLGWQEELQKLIDGGPVKPPE